METSLAEVFAVDLIDAIELGLSSDTEMADQIAELHEYSFISNSDSHSLAKIAREYQQIKMKEASFQELRAALQKCEGREIIANYGMNPKLGKYHSTVCQSCMNPVPYHTKKCPICASTKIVNGVYDRILQLKDTNMSDVSRPPYYYQVPLEYLPGLGPKTFEKLLQQFGTEMNVIHHSSFEKLTEVIPARLAEMIVEMRHGKLQIEAGGGGKYGRIKK